MSTLTVCRLRLYTSTYQTLRLAEPEAFYARFPRPFAGLSMAKKEDAFASIECLINEPERAAADFTALLPGMFVISQRVYDSRFYMAAMNLATEVADVSVNGERRYAVNVVEIFNALDRSRSVLTRTNDGRIVSVERYASYAERIGSESAAQSALPSIEVPESPRSSEIFTERKLIAEARIAKRLFSAIEQIGSCRRTAHKWISLSRKCLCPNQFRSLLWSFTGAASESQG